MSKIVKNNTASPVFVTDTGVTVPASGQYVIAPTDYALWAASSDIVTYVGNSTLTINDGSADLSISDGIDLIKGIYQKTRIIGNTDSTLIGNVGDRLKVDAQVTVLPSTVSHANILKQKELTISTKAQTAIAETQYTVPSYKTFALSSFGGSYDTQSPLYLRLQKQTGGTGQWDTLFRVTLKQHGQDESNHQIHLAIPMIIGIATDIFRITYESALPKGSLWAGFTGIEY